ncbi:hypothetical protein ACFZCY_18615 [Streptomyces sp. NPDC007983]|uniref:hypothetical protein n=1 Tax=Streptomyces sp. NPDC007983 TaxID=3364800 RepID=UPI0036E4D3C2
MASRAGVVRSCCKALAQPSVDDLQVLRLLCEPFHLLHVLAQGGSGSLQGAVGLSDLADEGVLDLLGVVRLQRLRGHGGQPVLFEQERVHSHLRGAVSTLAKGWMVACRTEGADRLPKLRGVAGCLVGAPVDLLGVQMPYLGEDAVLFQQVLGFLQLLLRFLGAVDGRHLDTGEVIEGGGRLFVVLGGLPHQQPRFRLRTLSVLQSSVGNGDAGSKVLGVHRLGLVQEFGGLSACGRASLGQLLVEFLDGGFGGGEPLLQGGVAGASQQQPSSSGRRTVPCRARRLPDRA